ncbi:hypothetical protein EZS27_013380 [termite gut metagenome]|uniref:Uncharacterized protein n=1 Tax=termite gut metagenome TaxID=433724 RepID=A0A5J4RXE7_9ZZZZ
MTNETEVKRSEMIDRLITTKVLHQIFDYMNIEYKEERYNDIDMSVTANTYHAETKTFSIDFTMDIEIKSRKCFVSTYNTSLMEVDKYNSLLQYNNDYKVYSVIYPLNNIVYLFNLNRINFNTIEKMNMQLPNETLTTDKIKYVNTECYMLPFELGTLFEFDCSKYY